MIRDVETKTKEILLKDFSEKISHNTLEGEQYPAAIMVKSVQDIQSSINDFKTVVEDIGKSSDKLSNRIFWLNIVLVAATIIGTIVTFLNWLYPKSNP